MTPRLIDTYITQVPHAKTPNLFNRLCQEADTIIQPIPPAFGGSLENHSIISVTPISCSFE